MVDLQIPLSEVENTSFYDLIEILNVKKTDHIDDPLALFRSFNGKG